MNWAEAPSPGQEATRGARTRTPGSGPEQESLRRAPRFPRGGKGYVRAGRALPAMLARSRPGPASRKCPLQLRGKNSTPTPYIWGRVWIYRDIGEYIVVYKNT